MTKYGRLTILRRVGVTKRRQVIVLCLCDCGVRKEVRQCDLKSGGTLSCGCYRRETATIAPRSTHGGRNTPEYAVWCAMRARCHNPNDKSYAGYGGRGIKVCEAWRVSFANFISDVGRRPPGDYSLERVDNNGNYEPGNVRWATGIEQGQNMRTNRLIEFGGEKLTLSTWARRIGIRRSTLQMRLGHGWSIERALTSELGGGNG